MKENISVIIPAYNEEAGIGKILDELDTVLKNCGCLYEVIVVDDCSTDKTYEIAKTKNIQLLQHPYNRGYGASLKTGIKHAKYNLILIIDADGTYGPQDIPKLLEFTESYDMVVGERPKASIEAIRRPPKWLLGKFANYLSGAKIPDLNSGLRIFKKDLSLKYFNILSERFSFTTTLTLAILSDSHTLKYVPVSYHKRYGKSKINPIKDTFNLIQTIVKITMYFNPLKIILPISLPLIFLGGSIVVYRLIFFHSVNKSSILLMVSGLQILALGLLADLINKRLNR